MRWYKIDKSSKVHKINSSDPRLTEHPVTMTRHGHWNFSKTLTLRSVTENDEGTYICSKSNGRNATRNITVYIDVAGRSLESRAWLLSCFWFHM